MSLDDNTRIATLTKYTLASQERLVRTSLNEHLEHARQVESLVAELKRVGAPIKGSFVAAGLDYQLARHSVWMADVVSRLSAAYPAILEFGPSLVLLIREAERRFAREDRLAELAELIDAVAGGMPRAEARERFIPPIRRVTAAAVLAALASGQFEQAKDLYRQCSPDDCRRLERVSDTLPDVIKRDVVEVRVRVAPVASSIEEAVCALAPGNGHAAALLQAGYSE